MTSFEAGQVLRIALFKESLITLPTWHKFLRIFQNFLLICILCNNNQKISVVFFLSLGLTAFLTLRKTAPQVPKLLLSKLLPLHKLKNIRLLLLLSYQ